VGLFLLRCFLYLYIVTKKEIMDFEQVIRDLKRHLTAVLPEGTTIVVRQGRSTFFGPDIRIMWSSHPRLGLNNPDAVSFCLESDWAIEPQMYGGIGGRVVTRHIDPNNPDEAILAYSHEKISWRKPRQKNKAAVFAALERFAKRWVQTLQKIEDMGLTIKDPGIL
jgi:hypothetical protein